MFILTSFSSFRSTNTTGWSSPSSQTATQWQYQASRAIETSASWRPTQSGSIGGRSHGRYGGPYEDIMHAHHNHHLCICFPIPSNNTASFLVFFTVGSCCYICVFSGLFLYLFMSWSCSNPQRALVLAFALTVYDSPYLPSYFSNRGISYLYILIFMKTRPSY